MDALVVRLSQLDVEAAGALRVVQFYDTLMRRRVDLPALARASAGLAGCAAGILLHGTGRTTRFGADGREASGTEQPRSTAVPVVLDGEEIGAVWLERPGPPRPLDELLLDRLAIAVAAVVERYGPARTTMADPALVELVVSASTEDAARERALRLLGFAPDTRLHVVAVRSERPLDRLAALLCPGRPAKAAPVGGVGVVLAAAVDPAALPADVRAGVGAAAAPDRCWREAGVALRFATAGRPVVRYADLGAVALLAEIAPERLRANPDVAAVALLATTPADLETLDAYCRTGSVRRAAELLHLHHSSVARRVEQLGAAVGIRLTDPDGLLRARMALAAWRLLDG
ncbi:helix-turn-helix domain-containing protein [Nocardia sp. NPDC057353]|uniref:helix-turn-helix domain-containing protein n=1 Tax=Nocardia sp. NPDC057353 TaxID=3346104 RepID=UPI00363C686F